MKRAGFYPALFIYNTNNQKGINLFGFSKKNISDVLRRDKSIYLCTHV
jgi:hypothetical protein